MSRLRSFLEGHDCPSVLLDGLDDGEVVLCGDIFHVGDVGGEEAGDDEGAV